MDSQKPTVAAGSSSTLNNKKPIARYQILHVKTVYDGPYPGAATPFDRIDILADATMVEELLPDRPKTPPTTMRGSPTPEPNCAAVFYFRGLEATLLCHYNEIESEASDFRLIKTNDAFKSFKGHENDRLDISHEGVGIFQEKLKDSNDNLFLAILFLFNENRIQMVAKKVGKGRQETILRQQDRNTLGIKEVWSVKGRP